MRGPAPSWAWVRSRARVGSLRRARGGAARSTQKTSAPPPVGCCACARGCHGPARGARGTPIVGASTCVSSAPSRRRDSNPRPPLYESGAVACESRRRQRKPCESVELCATAPAPRSRYAHGNPAYNRPVRQGWSESFWAWRIASATASSASHLTSTDNSSRRRLNIADAAGVPRFVPHRPTPCPFSVRREGSLR
jgi:hypothetical protein